MSSSSGAQTSGSPLNSGGLPTMMSGLPATESAPRRLPCHTVLALNRKDLKLVFAIAKPPALQFTSRGTVVQVERSILLLNR